MNRFRIKKTRLGGHITIPSSKSHTLRAILFGALGAGTSIIHHYLPSTDTLAMIAACRLFGATIELTPSVITIRGIKGKVAHLEDVIHAGNSGIVLRFCTALGALSRHPAVITGDYSIRHQRPMQPLLDGLSQLGVKAISMRDDGYAPIIVQGPIKSGKATICGEDSQPVSALLIAAAFADGPIELSVTNPGEKPWVALTLNWLDRLHIKYHNHSFEKYQLFGNAQYEGFEYSVPGDLSSAAFPIAAALITQSELVVKNIDMNDCQGDKELIHIFQKMGAEIDIDEAKKSLCVKNNKKLAGISVDINHCIDVITILAVVACYAEGETHIHNAAIAKHKECNRIHCIVQELKKMGANITETEDGLLIRGSALKCAELDSYNDHRMAMSLTVAALGCPGETIISSVECIAKTFPTFLDGFNTIGAGIEQLYTSEFKNWEFCKDGA